MVNRQPGTGDPQAGSVAETGEFGLISRVTAALPVGDGVLVGPGDDAAMVAAPGGRVLVSTDLMVEDRHFRRDWSEAADVGHKAAAANLADVAAMGGVATALVVGFAAPGDLDAGWAAEMTAALAEEAATVGASVVGGDVTAADKITIAVTVLGRCDADPVLRSGARPGDVVALAGRIGHAAAGYNVLARGFRSPRAVVEAHRRPRPPYAAGPAAAAAGATSMIDVSDGLLADLGHVALASGVAIDVDPAAFVVDEPLQAVGAALGLDPLGFCLTGGDDHPLVATFPSGTALPDGFTVVGRVADGAGVTVAGEVWDGDTGHQHYR
ncbi:thiamine-phosphate kinase [Solicola sp. PLA-1-18]|uniref:thiamine-phosphate kinase n=1 Tax=Solicola sp. PLA-1-18 TaxID=3380532 RepID=UPI003B78E6BC